MDALELALRCSNLLIKTMTKDKVALADSTTMSGGTTGGDDSTFLHPLRAEMNESDCERHFAEFGRCSFIELCIIRQDKISLLAFAGICCESHTNIIHTIHHTGVLQKY